MDFSLYYTPDYLQELAKKIRMPEAAAKAVLEQMSSLDLDTVNTLCSLLTDASVSFHEKADKIQQISSTQGGDLRCVLLYMTAAGQVKKRYQEKGIPDDIFYDSMNSMVEKMETFYKFHGRWGSASIMWTIRHLSFSMFRCGRLAFCIVTHSEPDVVYGGKTYLRTGEPYLAIHIPDNDPFGHDLVLSSYDKARWLFKTYFPEQSRDIRYFRCRSWLLFDGLKELLPPTSNILSFQRDFELVDQLETPPDDVLNRLFGEVKEELDEYQPVTSLQVNTIRYLKAGKKLGAGVGFIPF